MLNLLAIMGRGEVEAKVSTDRPVNALALAGIT